ncbi:MAG: hypothetical protein AAF430_17920 [Myxococcota bacterium]
MRRFWLWLGVCGLATGAVCVELASADAEPAGHDCVEPERPADMRDREAVAAFVEAANAYGSCLEDYIDAERLAARRHTQAADAAIDTWNAFAATL